MNFDFLNDAAFANFKDNLVSFCQKAEQYVFSDPEASVTNARKANEFIVKLCYSAIVNPGVDIKSKSTFDMLKDPDFQQKFKDAILIGQFHYIRRFGNHAAHGEKVSEQEAIATLGVLFQVVVRFVKKYLKLNVTVPAYVVPTRQSIPAPAPAVQNAPNEETKTPVVVPNAVIAEFGPRMRLVEFDIADKRVEAENQRLFWRACLSEAGWPIVNTDNTPMASSAAINVVMQNGLTADCILYDNANRPLAIIDTTYYEANPMDGRSKYEEMVRQIETQYGSKPVVYYKIGYQIFCIDQLGYESRRVFQIHTIDELETFKQRRSLRQDISQPNINPNIVDRPYQLEAVKAACNAFNDKRRKSLLVMATGTGKTRVSASIVDVLTRANWTERILFLADRISLASQAYKSFGDYLPNQTRSLFTGSSLQQDPNARIIFSTYQTMISLINDDTREFSMAHFDLIIIDEAHRSIFNKYGQLFNYFDALLLGLTATPRDEENKSTYDFFGLESGEPDYAYELEQAIKEKFLVGYTVLDRTTPALKRGIKYDDLTPEEKARFEAAFSDETDISVDFTGTVIDAAALKKEIINKGTIRTMLLDLMKNGLKVESGDKLGKTIIFAKSHYEAEVIVDTFRELFGYLEKDFCQLIDSQVDGAIGLIEKFGLRDKMPQVAVSVDMLDTGVDVPDILNLVFFKPVKSRIKFMQMIGRGTRLSKNIYAQGKDKDGFLIFDYYDNFGYFGNNVVEPKLKNYKSISQALFWVRLNIASVLQEMSTAKPAMLMAFDKRYCDDLRNSAWNSVRSLKNDDLGAMYNMAWVNKYRTKERWDKLDDETMKEIESFVVPLLPSIPGSLKVKAFDKLMLNIELGYVKRLFEGKTPFEIEEYLKAKYAPYMNARIEDLLTLKTIPDILNNEKALQSLIDLNAILSNFSLEKTEKIRLSLRDLMVYLPDRSNKPIILDVIDPLDEPDENDSGAVAPMEKSYADKAREYLNNHVADPALVKLSNLDPLDQAEKDELNKVFKQDLGSDAEFSAWSNGMPLLPYLRQQVGIPDSAIATKFGSFLKIDPLTQSQLDYLNGIVKYVRENGDLTTKDLRDKPNLLPVPRNDYAAFFGQNMNYLKQLVDGLHTPIQ